MSALAGLLLPTLLLAQGGTYTVQGQLGPRLPANKAYLSYRSGEGYQLDSATVRQGRFTFTGQVANPAKALLLLTRPGRIYRLHQMPPALTQSSELYLEPGTIRLLSPDSLANATLSGTPRNADQNRLTKLTQGVANQVQAIMDEWQAAPEAKRQDKVYEAAVDKRYFAAVEAGSQLRKQFLQQNPASFVSLDLLKDYAGEDYAVASPLLAGLAPAVRNSAAGQAYLQKLEKAQKLAVGTLAPDFTLPDPNGKSVKLSDFRGKYVLVDFWASWCVPCREENPNVLANYNKYKAQNFSVLGVSVDEATARGAWLKAIEADKLPWLQVSDLKGWKNEVAQLYVIQHIPSNVLVGPDGRIIAKNLRGEELGQKLAAVLPAAP